jgi:hypothetical protein
MPKKIHWKAIRLGIVALSFVSPFFGPPISTAASHMSWLAVGVVLVFFPIAMFVGVGVLLLLRGPQFDYQPPSWQVNPFNFAHPEQFFHLGAFATLAAGVAMLTRILFNSSRVTPEHLAPIAMGIGVWVGLRLLTAVYRRQVRNGI